MGIKGDIEGFLYSRKGLCRQNAQEMAQLVLEVVDDPNWAFRYANEQGGADMPEEEKNKFVLEYFDVVKFLREMVS